MAVPETGPILKPRIGIPGTIAVDAATGIVIALVLAGTLYTLVERPCMRMRSHPTVQRFIDRLRRDPVHEAAAREDNDGSLG